MLAVLARSNETHKAAILTLAKYSVSQVRSHCALAELAVRTRHTALRIIDDSMAERVIVVVNNEVLSDAYPERLPSTSTPGRRENE